MDGPEKLVLGPSLTLKYLPDSLRLHLKQMGNTIIQAAPNVSIFKLFLVGSVIFLVSLGSYTQLQENSERDCQGEDVFRQLKHKHQCGRG